MFSFLFSFKISIFAHHIPDLIQKNNNIMNLSGRRQSSNVDDRRRGGGGKKIAGGGIGAIIIAALVAYFTGGGKDAAFQAITDGIQQQMQGQLSTEGGTFTEEEDSLAKFSSQVLASTEDIWTKVFKEQLGKTYQPPKMVLYTGSVQTSCGNGQASMGPFYCSGDECVYLDISFLSTMKKEIGASGDFANAYVVGHEVAHHVQNLIGSLGKAHAQMARMSKEEANRMSVRIELQADFLAGVWGYYENKTFRSLDAGDMQEAIDCAHQIGDNYLQQQARGYVSPEQFTHGTSEQRMRWLKKGLTTGDLSLMDTFSVPYEEL